MEKLILNKGDKRILKKYLKYYAERLAANNSYRLATDFIEDSDDDYQMYYTGMTWMIEQMQHELDGIKTVKEQEKINENNNRIIN